MFNWSMEQKMVNWSTDQATIDIEVQIARRAVIIAKKAGINYSQLTASMDIDACHVNNYPLRLNDLLAADDEDFIHDVFGIREHMDRDTGKLRHGFVPRYAQKEI